MGPEGGELFPDQPGAVLAVREGTIADHRDAIVALVAAHERATQMLRDDPAAATAAVAKYVGGGRLDPEIVKAAIERSRDGFVADPNRITAGTKAMHDFQEAQGTLKQPVDLDALFDLGLYGDASGN
ncbi:ABC transporter substrate-binding protein [Mangrovicoccus ximenensis]|uniref:ABC transporter substrate-binding protein n=1 Tax=Mangrovicoccus ximenensis TaxID=1911570 RepID=UPI000D3902A2|nr:ABC transporter substrate-binding protein [Mangrovicoccus ximenensis]